MAVKDAISSSCTKCCSWSKRLAGSRATLAAFVAYNLAQGVIPQGVEPEELFPVAMLGLG